MTRTLTLMAAAVLAVTAAVSGQMTEKLDRGMVAVRLSDGGVYIGWRLLESDPPDVAFHVIRRAGDRAERITTAPITTSTNFVDAAAPKTGPLAYAVAAVSGGKESEPSGAIEPINKPYISIKLDPETRFQKCGIADLDGDGRYDYVIKHPDFNTDPYQAPGYWKKSQEPYKLEAYSADGRRLWRHDMGWSIETGIWYSPYVVYDLDGDGKAEVYAKAGEGDPRTPEGHVKEGPEWLVKLDGMTGKVLKKIPWPGRDGIDSYNHQSRNMLAVAYLDGKRPHLTVHRGTYTLMKVEAYDPDLKNVWKWDSHMEKEGRWDAQGAHTVRVADIDGDGRDELILGSSVLDDNGKGIWTLGIGHPDTIYVGDIDPARQGMEIFLGIEPRQKSGAVRLVEAATGKTIWANSEPTVHVHGQGMCADIMAEHPGQECYAGEAKGGDQYWLFTAGGKRIGSESIGGLAPSVVLWDADPQKELFVGGKVRKFKGPVVYQPEDGMKRTVMVADVIGDWREEIIGSDPGELRIYTTTIPATTRRPCLMQDRLYRLNVAGCTMGYHTVPQHSKP